MRKVRKFFTAQTNINMGYCTCILLDGIFTTFWKVRFLYKSIKIGLAIKRKKMCIFCTFKCGEKRHMWKTNMKENVPHELEKCGCMNNKGFSKSFKLEFLCSLTVNYEARGFMFYKSVRGHWLEINFSARNGFFIGLFGINAKEPTSSLFGDGAVSTVLLTAGFIIEISSVLTLSILSLWLK